MAFMAPQAVLRDGGECPSEAPGGSGSPPRTDFLKIEKNIISVAQTNDKIERMWYNQKNGFRAKPKAAWIDEKGVDRNAERRDDRSASKQASKQASAAVVCLSVRQLFLVFCKLRAYCVRGFSTGVMRLFIIYSFSVANQNL